MTSKQRLIVELIRDAPHMTADDVAETLEVSRSTVYWVAKRYGLRCKSAVNRVTDRDRARALSMARHGIADGDIAARLGFAKSTIEEIRRRGRVRHRGGPIGPPTTRQMRLEIARRYLIHGHSYREIRMDMKVTTGVIAGVVYRAKHENWDLSEGVEMEVERV